MATPQDTRIESPQDTRIESQVTRIEPLELAKLEPPSGPTARRARQPRSKPTRRRPAKQLVIANDDIYDAGELDELRAHVEASARAFDDRAKQVVLDDEAPGYDDPTTVQRGASAESIAMRF